MAKTTSLAELHAARTSHAEGKPRKRVSGALARRAERLNKEIAELPVTPLLIGAGLGAALLGAALALTSKRRAASPLNAIQPALTKAALIAASRIISGQPARSVATSALLDVAEAVKR